MTCKSEETKIMVEKLSHNAGGKKSNWREGREKIIKILKMSESCKYFDITRDELIKNINDTIDEIEVACNNRDEKSLSRLLGRIITLGKNGLKSDELHTDKLVKILFEISVRISDFSSYIYSTSISLLLVITSSPKLIPRNVELDVDKYLDFTHFCEKRNNINLPFKHLLNFYFSKEDNEKILRLWKDRIGVKTEESAKYTVRLFSILSPSLFPQISDLIFKLIEERTYVEYVIIGLTYIYQYLSGGFGNSFNFVPYVDLLFDTVLFLINHTYTVLGNKVSQRVSKLSNFPEFTEKYSIKNREDYAIRVIALLLQDGEIGECVISRLKVIVPFITKFISAKKGKVAIDFASCLFKSIKNIQHKINNGKGAEYIKLSTQMIKEAYELLVPLLNTAIFSCGNVAVNMQAITLCEQLSVYVYDSIKEQILMYAIENSYNESDPIKTNICGNVLIYLLPHMLSNERKDEAYDVVPQIVDIITAYFNSEQKNIRGIGSNLLSCLTLCLTARAAPDNYCSQILCERMIPFIDAYMRDSSANTTKTKPFKYSLNQLGIWTFIFASLPDETIRNIAEHLTEYFTQNDVAIYSFCSMLRALSTTHGSIALPIIYPKLKSLYSKKDNSAESKRKYIHFIEALFCVQPSTIPYIEEMMSIGFENVKSDNKILRKAGKHIILEILRICRIISSTDFTNLESNDMKEENIFTTFYALKDIKQNFYMFGSDVLELISSKFLAFVEEEFKEFDSKDNENQKLLLKLSRGAVDLFIPLFHAYSDKQFEKTESAKKLEVWYYETHKKLLAIEALKMKPKFATLIMKNILKLFIIQTVSGNFLKSLKKKEEKYKYAKLLIPKLHVLRSYQVVCDVTNNNAKIYSQYAPATDEMKDLSTYIFPWIFHDQKEVSAMAKISFRSCFNLYGIPNEPIDKIISVLRNEVPEFPLNATTFTSIISFFDLNMIECVAKRPALFVKLLDALLCLKIDPAWNAKDVIPGITNCIRTMAIRNYCLKESKEFKEFVHHFHEYKPIDETIYKTILSFICSTSVSLTQQIIDILLSYSEKASIVRSNAIASLTHFLYTIKPTPQKIPCDDPKIVNSECVGYNCKPESYLEVSGPYEFHDNEEIAAIRQHLKETVNAERIKRLLDASVLYKKEDNPYVENSMCSFWRRLAQNLSYHEVVEGLEEAIIGMADYKQPASVAAVYDYIIGLFKAAKCWTSEDREKLVALIVAIVGKALESKSQALVTPTNQFILSFCSNVSSNRYMWLFQIFEKLINENEGMKLKNIINNLILVLKHMSWRDRDLYNDLVLRVILPRYKQLDANPLEINCLSRVCYYTANFFGCPRYTEEKTCVKEMFEYFDTLSPDCSFVLYSSLLATNSKKQISFLGPYIIERIPMFMKQLLDVSEKYQPETALNLLNTPQFIDTRNAIPVFDNILSIVDKFPWTTRVNIIGLAHIFILDNVFNISNETYEYLSNKFVPHFIEDKNTDVQKEATEALKILIQIRMTDEKMQHDYALQAVNGMKESDSNSPIIIAIALIGFVQFTKKCPDWLQLLFQQIEKKFRKHHPLSKMIENATKDFFKRYQYYDVPEIDEFRYLFGASYIC